MARRAKEKEKRERKRGKSRIGIVLIVFILLVVLAPVGWYFVSISPVDRGNYEEIQVTIPLGSGTRAIATILAEYGVIRNETIFHIYVRFRGDMNFQAGTYYFKQSMRLGEIVNMLQTGILHDPNQITITFIEGRNMRGLARLIEERTNNTVADVFELLSDREYIASLVDRFWFLTEEIEHTDIFYPLEGYLFPDTYVLRNEDVTVEEIFEIMLNRTDEILSYYSDEIQASGRSVHEILTIASVVETETNSLEGAKYVSSIIVNRLAINMPLGMDPTAYYALGLDPWERDLYLWELNLPNPYNTRGPNMEGRLPIGPIAAPSRNSIQAALRPPDTNYLFFVSDSYGALYFRETYQGHSAIIRELRAQGIWYNDIRR
ncbi:MAG: endolytic transglycosylase MltG [Oscillospiraceae bacterium]|nr:endolytic transglycosylase MltG [Oscillospiraceae bacterium]